MDEKDKEKIGGVAPQHPDWGKLQPAPEHAGDKPAKGDRPGQEGIQDREGRDPDLPGSKPET
jgi:hypothetical protein